MTRIRTRYRHLIYLVSIIFLLGGCSKAHLTPVPSEPDVESESTGTAPPPEFHLQTKEKLKQFASSARIKEFSNAIQGQYLLGPGDVMDISIWRRAEISRKDIVVAPDGVISLPKVGVLNVKGKTVAELSDEITTILEKSYESPEATIIVRQFHNNKAFVLGRVSEPGVVNFPGDGTLLEALALAGGLPHIGKETFLTKCAIIRGKDTVIWIDLRDLLDNGNMALNARILNNDVIFIPEAEDEMIMVLGEVEEPGPVMLKRGLNLVDAVMRSGGYTIKANLEKVFIIRQEGPQATIKQVDFGMMLEQGDFSENYALVKDDIVYVAPTGVSKYNYMLEQIMPSLEVLSMSASILDNLGITNTVFSLEDDE